MRAALRRGQLPGWPRPLRSSVWIEATGALALHRGRGWTGWMERGDDRLASVADGRAAAGLAARAPTLVADGPGRLAALSGGFALAWWDGARRAVVLARDRLGQRALYLRDAPEGLWFASELELLLLPGAELDPSAALSYLLRGHPPPGRTLARDVRSVPAAHAYVVDVTSGVGQAMRYWTPLAPPPSPRRRSAAAALRAEVTAAVTASLTASASGSTALLLSGGVDSSMIACLAAGAAAPPPPAFTIACVEGDEREDDLPDVHYARMVAARLAAPHTIVRLGADEAAARLPGLLEAPEPASAWTALAHAALLTRAAAAGCDHVLSGMGADELFGGYQRVLEHHHLQQRYLQRAQRPRAAAAAAGWLGALLEEPAVAAATLFPGVARFFERAELAPLLSSRAARLWPGADLDFYREAHRLAPAAGSFALMAAHECHHRIPELLMRSFEPRAAAAGVAISYPFLDDAPARIATSLTADQLYWFERGAWWAKLTLRLAARGVVPAPIVMRRRTAYDVPIARWMRAPRFGRVVLEHLADSPLWSSGLFSRRARGQAVGEARALTRGAVDGTVDDAPACERTWALLTLAAWYGRYLR